MVFAYTCFSFIRKLIDQELVDFVASDSHSSTWRAPDLGAAAEALTRRWGSAVADRLTRLHAAEVVMPKMDPAEVLAR